MKHSCLKDRCYSPVACGGFGYCRERNFEHAQWTVKDDCLALLEAIDAELLRHGQINAGEWMHDRIRRTISLLKGDAVDAA